MKINLIECFSETVERNPNRIAVVENERSIDFRTLNRNAYVIAQQIYESGVDINRPVAVFLGKSIESITVDLGILIAGDFYMNLDIKTPAERIRNILNLINPGAIISDKMHFKLIQDIIPDNIKCIDIDELRIDSEVDYSIIDKRRGHLIDTDPSCIINTSGSTGTPKGVVLNHRSFFDFIEWSLDTFKFEEDMIMGSLSPMVFDIYSYELCMLMTKGATLVVIPDTLSAFPAKILDILDKNRINFIFWVPTIMVNIANMDLLSTYKLDSLKIVWFAGEVFPTKQFNYWHRHLSNVTFANLYGPIEITLDCTYFIVDREIPDEEPIPIGRACRNTSILILDENDKLITESKKEGELCVRGSSLAMGYYNNPEKTATAFTQNPLNTSYPEIIYRTGDVVTYNDRGEIVFVGRRDNLVKHMGYRTDLGEIEHIIINKLKLVNNGCICYNTQAKKIVLYYEAEGEITPGDFRKAIGKELPKYMLPTEFVYETELKRNTNGKIDRLHYKNLVNGCN